MLTRGRGAAERRKFTLHVEACERRQKLVNARDRCLVAVRHGERIKHVEVGKARQELRKLCIARFFLWVEANIF